MKTKKLRQSAKYTIIISIFLLAMNYILGYILIKQSKAAMTVLMNERMLDVSNTAAASLDGDLLASIDENSIDNDAYNEIVEDLRLFQDNIDLAYIYTVKDMGGRHFGFIIDPDPDDPGLYGEEVTYTDALYKASLGTPGVDTEAFDDRWGTFYSAYSPVFDSNGNVAGIVGVDFNAKWYERQIKRYTVSIVIVSVLSLFIGAIIVILITTQVRKRLNVVYDELSSLAEDVEHLNQEMTSNSRYSSTTDNLTTDELELYNQSSKNKRHLTRDAIGALGDKINLMYNEMTHYISYVQEQAYTDSMNGVGNKTAYLDMVKRLNSKIAKGSASFAIAVFDVNGLKSVNDNLGHEYGDMIISDTALIIKRVFENGHIFRIGGDEFITVMEGRYTDKYIIELFKELDNELASFNANEKTYEMTLSFSKGASVFRPESDSDYQTVFKRADEAMYANKGQYYRQFGDRRRRSDDNR
ncbi:MAG: diguanylate cyclase [Lachnospiraceae bacterium]|nr:diguanylate cyclase [Lachnospiraceae bacterium]